jgi:hypothetical protein
MINSTVGRNLRKVLFVFNILLAGLGAWMLFDVVSFWVSPPGGGREPAINSKGEAAAKQGILIAPRSLKDYELLSTADIFKSSPRANPSAVRTNPQGPQGTSLDLKLKGTILGNNARSYAVIEDGKTKTQLLYSLNELVRGAKIIAIEPDHVVLSVQGKDEMLMMSEEGEPETASVRPPPGRFPPGARSDRGNRGARQPAIKPKPPGRTAQQSSRNGAPTQDKEFPSEGGQPGEEGSQSESPSQQSAEDQPSQ